MNPLHFVAMKYLIFHIVIFKCFMAEEAFVIKLSRGAYKKRVQNDHNFCNHVPNVSNL